MHDVTHGDESTTILRTESTDKPEIYDIFTIKSTDQKSGRRSRRYLANAAFCEKNALPNVRITAEFNTRKDLLFKQNPKLI